MPDYSLESKAFYKALEDGQLIGSRCPVCGYVAVPQRQICPKCHSDKMEVLSFSGYGSLAAYTVVYVPPSDMLKAGYNGKNPYCVGIVTLKEGPRVNAQILGLDLSQPAEIQIGMDVKMTTITRGEGEVVKTFLAFEPV